MSTGARPSSVSIPATRSRHGVRRRTPASCALGAGARRALDRFRAAASRAGVRLVIAEEAPGAVGCCTDAELDRMLEAQFGE